MFNYILKRGLHPLFFSFLLINLFVSSYCQQPTNLYNNDDIISPKKSTGFTLIPLIANKAIITKNIDKYSIKTSPQIGIEASINNYFYLDKSYSIILGLSFGLYLRNLNYVIPKNELNPQANEDFIWNGRLAKDVNFTLGLPFLFEKKWFLKKKKGVILATGFTLRYAPVLHEGIYLHWYNTMPFQIELIVNPEERLWVNYNIGVGYSRPLKNKNLFKASLIGNISFTSFEKGNYQFTLPNQPIVEGLYQVKGSYIGLSFSYIVTGTNRILHKIKKRH